jgi:two-component system nitrogen regulation sensor histidine kinase NtrY
LFRKYPYWGWLSLALIFWGVAVMRFTVLQRRTTPEAMTATVSKDFQKRQKALDAFIENQQLVQHIFKDSLSIEEADALSEAPFFIYAFRGDYDLVYWNSNTVVGTCSQEFSDERKDGLYRYNGTFYKQCLHLSYLKPEEHLVALFPLRYKYSIQNNYLHSLFLAADYIPLSTTSSFQKGDNSYPVLTAKKQVLFYLNILKDDVPRYIPDTWLTWLLMASILTSLLWLHMMAIGISRRYHPFYGLALILAASVLLIAYVYSLGAPFYFNELSIFSPGLYASSHWVPSLAALLIVLLCLLWVLLFIIFAFKKPAQKLTVTVINFIGIVVCMTLLAYSTILPVIIIRNLVLDSSISFDVSSLASITSFTPAGLFTVIMILCCSVLIIYHSSLHLKRFIPSNLLRYILIVVCMAVCYIIAPKSLMAYPVLCTGFTLVFVLYFDIFISWKQVKLFSPETIIAGIMIALSATFLLHHFNTIKRKTNEKIFAEKIVKQRDEMMEFLFTDVDDSLKTDLAIQGYLLDPRQTDRSYIDEYISTRYLRGPLNRYNVTSYFYNNSGSPVYNADTLSLSMFDTLLTKATSLPLTSDLYYLENAKDGRYYVAKVPLQNNAGTIVFAFQLKQHVAASVYPELLQPGSFLTANNEASYTYGIYAMRELITQNNDYPFPVYLRSDTMKAGTMRVLKREGYNIHVYKIEEGKRVAIIDSQEPWVEMVTLFSYVLCILLVGAVVVFLLTLYFRYLFRSHPGQKIIRITLRNRIHNAMLGVVLLSFALIGAATIFVFTDRYDKSSKTKLRNAMQTVERSVQEYLRDKKIAINEKTFHDETQTARFRNFISKLAGAENLDINIYNSEGSLNATSQEDIYNKSLLARIMMPKAYYEMSKRHSALLVEKESIGKLQYLSSYIPLRNMDGNAVGFINVPFFSSQKELNYQISNILIALINIYVIVFLVSGLLAVGITSWLTKGFHVLIEKFKTFNLGDNEKIAWAYDDEIGLLLREYNKMVDKVVENARRLAQTEREMAWREMAKQVAHEIKNPLTPMKLNIQYLQQALDRNHPDIEQLTKNVSASLIEQIDNLSHIASAFSDFAKMPEATPENVLLNDVLAGAVTLYNNGSAVAVRYEKTDELLICYIDKSQLLRILTNLLKNATEAIPEDRAPQITVSLVSEGEYGRITIEDNGIGISDEVAARIFSPYFTTKGSGTGLGLAMTRKIVEFWNGRIWFETKTGEGTTFFIELPIKARD